MTYGFEPYNATATILTDFSFKTILPEDGQSIIFEFAYFHLVDERTGATFTPVVGHTPTMTHTGVNGTFSAYVVVDSVTQEGSQLFQASVNEQIKYDLQLSNSIIGDGALPTSAGAIRIVDTSAEIKLSNLWSIYSEIGITSMALHSLRCREMLALRRVTTVFYNGSFIGTPNPFKGFAWDGKYWIWTSINWNAQENTYQGTALQLNYATDPS